MNTLALLASGTGSNVGAILAAAERGDIDAPIACIACDRPGAPVVARARAAGVEALEYNAAGFGDRREYESRLVADLAARGVTHVVLAGYMRLCGEVFLGAYGGLTINVHPSLLPAFAGKHAIRRAVEAGVKRTGVSVHFIDDGVDTGPVVCRAAVDVTAGEKLDELERRIHAQEHVVLPIVTAGLVAGELHLAPGAGVRMAPALAARLQAVGATPAVGAVAREVSNVAAPRIPPEVPVP